MANSKILTDLIEAKLPINDLKKQATSIPWDSGDHNVVFEIHHGKQILERFLDGKLKSSEVEEWANLIECRESIDFNPKHATLLKDFIHELANPVLTEPLTTKSASKWLEAFVVPSVREAFEQIQEAFPHLKSEIKNVHTRGDLELSFPKQKGLNFNVSFELQDAGGLDELRLWADGFSFFWLLSPEPGIEDIGAVKKFRAMALGILSGKYRIEEHKNRKGVAIKYNLQELSGAEWKTITSYSHGWHPFNFGAKTIKIIQNVEPR